MVREMVLNSATCMWCAGQISNGTCNCGSVRVGNARNPTQPDDDGDTFEASRKAAQATLDTGHRGAGTQAIAALDSLKAGNPTEAVTSHLASAKTHKNEAQSEREGRWNDDDGQDHEVNADQHDKAAGLHIKAAKQIVDSITTNSGANVNNQQPMTFEEQARQDRFHHELVVNADVPLSSFGTEEGTLSLPVMNYTDDLYSTPKPKSKDKGKASGSNADLVEQEDRMGTDQQYGDAPPVKKVVDGKRKIAPNVDDEIEDDGLIVPTLADIIDGRGKASLTKRTSKGVGAEQQSRDDASARKGAALASNVSYPEQSDLLLIPTINWETGNIG